MNGAQKPRRRAQRKARNTTRYRNRGRSVERATAPLQHVTTMVPTQMRLGYGQGWQKLSHEEIILQVFGDTKSDTIQEVAILPRMSPLSANSTFVGNAQHLSQMGSMYSMHRWRAISFEWIPSCPTTTPGNVVLRFYPSYNTTTPTKIINLMDNEALIINPSVTGKTYRPQISTKGDLPGLRNINATGFTALDIEDKCDYSIGRLVIGASMQALGLQLGLIRMKYSIEMRGPVVTET